MAISKDDITRVARLAHLSLSEDEISSYQEQLSSVLEYMDILNEVDVSQVPITAQVTGLEDVFRDDVVVDCPEVQQQAIIAEFPKDSDGVLTVPAVFE